MANMIKILIGDDHAIVRKGLKQIVSETNDITIVEEATNGHEVLAKISSVKRSVKWFNENTEPDLVFMDIQLADGLSFDIFEQCKINCPVIFTTAFDEYAIKAFKVNSVDYLLKPFDFDELSNSIEQYKSKFSDKSKDSALQYCNVSKLEVTKASPPEGAQRAINLTLYDEDGAELVTDLLASGDEIVVDDKVFARYD